MYRLCLKSDEWKLVEGTQKLWFKGVRSSKFRHVYGEPAKREKCYDNIQITKNAHDSQFCAVNPKFVAIVTEVAGGGAFIVIPINCTGRLDFNASRVTGHSGPILDIKWNPFNDNVIASCSDDCTIKLWHIPDEGLSVHLTDWLVELQGHKRRVGYIEWHPTAENVLFSAGFDHLVIVWDIEKAEAINVIDCHRDAIHSMSLNRDGSLLATTCKDKKLRIIEPRSGIVKAEINCHAGAKASKVVYLGATGRLLTTGFSRHSDRQYSVWDESDLSQPLFTDSIDSSSGVVFPFFDPDTNMVYLAGKGDGNIRYYEVTDEAPYVHYLSQFLSGNPQRGLGFMPKRGVRTSQCEIFRFYKLHATKGMCEPIGMIVPRKSDQFHDDLYPDTAGTKPALSAQEWIKGKNAMPILISMRTGEQNELNITSIKQRNTAQIVEQPKLDNNKRKFAFLSRETIPDYRPKEAIIMEKSRKTSNNENFQKLQQKFNQIEMNNHQDVHLIKEVNSIGDNILTENDLRRAYQSQSEEIRKLKKQLLNSEQRVKELEEQLKRLLKN
ncbi:coronin-2B-like isoform X2 [Diorhabda sublineata]|uniref:coronin-2B-like isoform X2 n=1 Tax=Diorhabda sublineata TaxID=1163346 RepID=UPI0024E0B132|nr:coronin-2B-like isoform X2 [Diorhabda sublineata]